MGFWLDHDGNYYEGDRAQWQDEEVPQRPSVNHVWHGGAWAMGLKTAAQIAAEIEAAYIQAINIVAAPYPATERDSWPKQEQEARAYIADNAAPTPLLSAIATSRGMTLAALAARVVSKADSYAVLAGEAIGRRGARMDAIAAAVAANDQAALEAIVW